VKDYQLKHWHRPSFR